MNDDLKKLVDDTLKKYQQLTEESPATINTKYTPVFMYAGQKFIIPHDHLFYDTEEEALNPEICPSIVMFITTHDTNVVGTLEVDIATSEGNKRYICGKIGFPRSIPFVEDVIMIGGSIYDEALKAGEEMFAYSAT